MAAEDTLRTGAADLWVRADRDEASTIDARLELRLRMVTACRFGAAGHRPVDDAAGMSSVRVPSPLERAWRDAHTASQHVLLSVGRVEVAGRLLLGLDPESPVI